MPHTSACQELLDNLNLTALHVMHARDQNHDMQLQANEESDADESDPGDLIYLSRLSFPLPLQSSLLFS